MSCSHAVGVDVRHILRMAITRRSNVAFQERAGEHGLVPGILDGDLYRDRQPVAATAHRLHDGFSGTSDVPDDGRPVGVVRLGPDQAHQARLVSVRVPDTARLRHGRCVHRVARLPGRNSRRRHTWFAQHVLPGHELVRHTVRVRRRLDGVVRHSGGHNERGI